MPRLRRYLWFTLALAAAGCAASRPHVDDRYADWDAVPPPAEAPAYRVFLVGGAGTGDGAAPVLALLREQLHRAGDRSAVVFLGDSAPGGLPDSSDVRRAAAEALLAPQLDAVRGRAGRIVFVPGDADARGGREALARLETFVETSLGEAAAFVPDDGFPGPAVVELDGRVTLVALGTGWWLSDDPPLGDTGDYDLREPTDLLVALEDVLEKHWKDEVLVVGHHPLYSNGPHGGRFSAKTHLRPLPLLGSVVPLYRRFIGRRQDLAHGRYRLFRREMQHLFAARKGLVYAAAHDASLQYFRRQDRHVVQHYLVSGAGAGATYAAGGRGAALSAAVPGFLSLQYYDDGAVWLEAWAPGDGPAGRLLFRTRIKEAQPDLQDDPRPAAADLPDYRDSTVVRAVNARYARGGGLRRLLLGRHHRTLWATPVEAPVLDVARTAGGLTPLRVGGQSQSVTMRLRGGDGTVYMLRSIDKVAGRAWPPELRRTMARTMAQDQVSMLHPFGAFAVAPLADAAGVFHTNPRLVFVPDDPRLGGRRGALAGRLALFEERPDEDMSDVPGMGGATNVIGSTKMLREVTADNDHRVDARTYARARLFDMLVGDFDRTTDNWRWGAFEPYELDPSLEGEARKQGKVYLAVPRDRDAAMMKVDGLLPTLYRLLAEPTWQPFGPRYGYLLGLNKKGLPLDRRFTAALTRDDWVALADSIRAALTDEALEAAVRTWPAPVFDAAGAETIAALRARRDALPAVAARYYGVLARVVDVVGSHKHERFEVTRLNDDATEVVVYKTSKEGEVRRELFRRTLRHDETEELRLYGLDGNDRFVVRGAARRGLLVRAVGGAGDDAFVDRSSVRGRSRLTHFYDVPGATTLEAGPETRAALRDDPRVNRYDPGAWQPDRARPVAFFGSNKDDGLFVGGGVAFTRHGFRKAPHAALHRIAANFAARTQAFNVRYRGHYVDVAGAWDAALDVGVYSPNNVRNFYGLGNETRREEDARYYQARFSRVAVRPALVRTLDGGVSLRLGPTFEYTDVRQDEGRFVGQPQAGVSARLFDRRYYGGAEAALRLDNIDDAANPAQGFRFDAAADLNADLQHAADTYARLSSRLSVYYSPSLSPQVTLALRAGGAHNVGTFPFFAANTLGGAENLRGYRKTRFAGRTSFFQNVELRARLATFSGALGYGDAGALGFIDQGRVWTDGERSRAWHRGYGGGLWLHAFDAATLTATYGRSAEDATVTVQLGFLF